MAKPITAIGGVITSNALNANLDALYGTYDTVADAINAIGQRRLSASCVGLTVGIKNTTTGEVTEYWVQPITGGYGLVPKGGSGSQPIEDVEVTILDTTDPTQASGEIDGTTLILKLPKGAKGDDGEQGETGADGKSAYQVWLDDNGWTAEQHPVSEYINSLKAHVSGFVPVAYDSTAAGKSIGQTFDFALENPVDGSMVLMPNAGSSATGSIMFSVSVQDGVATYTRVGDVDIDTSNFLNTSSMDSTNLKNPTASQVAKASDVMGLKAKLEGVTAVETKQAVADWHPDGLSSGYYDSSAEWHTSSNYKSARFTLADGVKYVRFLGFNRDYSNYNYGYGFLDSDGVVMVDTFKQYRDPNRGWEPKCEIKVDVPAGAKYFVCLYTAWSTQTVFQNFTESDFYCYIKSGDGVIDVIDNLSGQISVMAEESVMTVKTLPVTSVAKGFIRTANGKWTESPSYYHGYVDMDEYVGQRIKVTNNASKETNIAFVTAIDTVVNGGSPSYVDGWANVVKPAGGELGGSQVFVVPEDANYMYVYVGTNGGAMPTVEVVQHVTEVVEDILDEDGMVPERLFPLWTPWHINNATGEIASDGNWEMFAQPVKAGDRLRLTAIKNTTSSLSVVLYGFSDAYPAVGDVIDSKAISGQQGVTQVVELTAETDGWLVFSSSFLDGAPAWSYTLDMLLPLSAVVAPKMSKGLEYGMRELHFTDPLTDGVIAETYSEIHGMYEDLVTAHGEAFERLSDILENDGSDNEIRLYRLGYKGFGGVFTGYDFENAAANGYYADTNDGGRSHGKKRILLDAGMHGNEKAAVYGLYYFCKSVLESNDPWAVYIKSNFVIDVIPIVSTKNYMNNSRTGTDNIDPNRNFGVRTLVQVAAAAAYVDSHAGEYNLHIDCHNYVTGSNSGAKCFVGCLRGSKGFEDMVEFARRFSGIARGNWGLLPWYKSHASDETPVKVTDPMIVIQTNASSDLVADNYKMTYPSCTRVYGAISITIETPRQLTNVSTSYCHYDAAKPMADMLIELTRLADGAGLADGADW